MRRLTRASPARVSTPLPTRKLSLTDFECTFPPARVGDSETNHQLLNLAYLSWLRVNPICSELWHLLATVGGCQAMDSYQPLNSLYETAPSPVIRLLSGTGPSGGILPSAGPPGAPTTIRPTIPSDL